MSYIFVHAFQCHIYMYFLFFLLFVSSRLSSPNRIQSPPCMTCPMVLASNGELGYIKAKDDTLYMNRNTAIITMNTKVSFTWILENNLDIAPR